MLLQLEGNSHTTNPVLGVGEPSPRQHRELPECPRWLQAAPGAVSSNAASLNTMLGLIHAGVLLETPRVWGFSGWLKRALRCKALLGHSRVPTYSVQTAGTRLCRYIPQRKRMLFSTRMSMPDRRSAIKMKNSDLFYLDGRYQGGSTLGYVPNSQIPLTLK